MKVGGMSPASPFAGARGAGRAAPAGFETSPDVGATAPASAPASLGAVSSLDALLALQEAMDPAERRRRGVRRAGRLLDALDALKLALLEGGLGGEALQDLQAAARETRHGVDDPNLDSLLGQIELRAAVELAKRQPRAASVQAAVD